MAIKNFIVGSIEVSVLIYSLLFNVLVCVPFFIKKIFRVNFSPVVSIVFYLYMFVSAFLGVELRFYAQIAMWDILVHFLMGMLVAVLSIYILNVTVYKKDIGRHNLGFTVLFMICFSVVVGVLWEIGEFVVDIIFDSGFQRYMTYDGTLLIGQKALIDTMVDLVIDFAGALMGVGFVLIALKIDKNFLKTFRVKRIRKRDSAVESIEE
ncbi:MAG: hypothetical protein IJ318_01035 [Clostridia bacterium]|nr:hypothetical protein [Clostridia bacterium]